MTRSLFWIALLVTLVVLALVGRKMLAPHSVQPSTAGESLQWPEHRVGGVVLKAPSEFQDIKVDFGSANEAIEQADAHQFASRALEIQVIRIFYKEGIALNLEDSVQGSIDGFAHAPGLRNLTHNEAVCTVSGKPAMRVFVTADRARGGIRLEGETILDGQTLYQIQALYEARDLHASQDARKILDSIRIGP